MKKKQLISLWIFGLLWAFTLLIWYASDSYSWGIVHFFQATIFWGIFCFLSHITLGQDWSRDKKAKIDDHTTGTPVDIIAAKYSEIPKEGNAMIFEEKEGNSINSQINNFESTKSNSYKLIEYYAVSLRKLIILSLCTFGLYQLYWHYKNWKVVREQRGEKITPSVRAFFAAVTSFGLFKRILLDAKEKGYVARHSAATLWWAYFLLLLVSRTPDKIEVFKFVWLLSIFSFIPLLEVQKAINFNLKPEDKFSGKDLLVIIIGGLLVCLGVVGTFMPENNLVQKASSLGRQLYSSDKFNYQISVPSDWTIIERKSFGEFEKSLENTDAEIMLMNKEGTNFCLVTPEVLEGYGEKYGIEELKNAAISNIQEDKSMILETSRKIYWNGHDGFEVYYYQRENGQIRKYMTFYICYENIAIGLTAWAFEADATKAFNEVKNIAESIHVD